MRVIIAKTNLKLRLPYVVPNLAPQHWLNISVMDQNTLNFDPKGCAK